MPETNETLKGEVRAFWDKSSCGEIYAQGEEPRSYYESHARTRYALEPVIPLFARFGEARDKDVLEIGVGMGADHIELAKAGPRGLTGVDLTPRAIEHVTRRLQVYGLNSRLQVADAEHLPFADESFDFVYSWGVLHHSPDTPQAIREVWRILRPGGKTRVMIYHKYSLVGYMLWLRYALMRGRPGRSLAEIYAQHLESPGTKAYSMAEARRMFGQFSQVEMRAELGFGDLLEGGVGQRHRGPLLSLAKRLWPRWFFKRFMKGHGLGLLVEAVK